MTRLVSLMLLRSNDETRADCQQQSSSPAPGPDVSHVIVSEPEPRDWVVHYQLRGGGGGYMGGYMPRKMLSYIRPMTSITVAQFLRIF